MLSQLDLFEPSKISEDHYFTNMLASLAGDSGPAWPDRFGLNLRTLLKSHKVPSIRTISLFSGGGGLDIGFGDAGFHSVQMVEIEKTYVETLQKNAESDGYFEGSEQICIDIRSFHPLPSLNIDFVIGGPPCQSFSAAGRRASGVQGIDDPRGVLFAEYIRIIRILQPKGFLFENVYGITGAQGGDAWIEIQRQFHELGYVLSHRIVDAADYGVPQHRERLIIVGILNKEFQFPEPTHGPDSKDENPYYTAGIAVSDASVENVPSSLGGQYGHLIADIPPGLNYSFYTEKMGYPNPIFGWRSKFSDFLYKADPDTPVRTIKAQGGQYTGPFSWENRHFSVPEYKRLQTFPDTYHIIGGRQKCIEQIGNSVPPQLARLLALSILEQVFDIKLPFHINYLSKEQKLGFRTRKREMTNLYQSRANTAIELMSPQIPKANIAMHLKTQRWITNSFLWTNYPTKHGKEINLEFHSREQEWEISSKEISDITTAEFAITISASRGVAWEIPAERVIIRGDTSYSAFTGAWKFFEEMTMTASNIADLVQLSNYYQYKPRFKAQMYLNNLDKELKPLLWKGIQSIVNGLFLAKPLRGETIAELLEVPQKEVLIILTFARKLGYEIRNQNTNPQMVSGEYLIPYIFPTLTSRSVQLHKSLEEL